MRSLIGSGTLLQDDPRLTARGAFRRRPLVRVILDRRLRTPIAARVLSTLDSGPVIIVTRAADVAPVARPRPRAGRGRRTLDVIAGRRAARSSRRRCAGWRLPALTSVILEGGPTVHRAFWDHGLVDRVQMYVAPRAHRA